MALLLPGWRQAWAGVSINSDTSANASKKADATAGDGPVNAWLTTATSNSAGVDPAAGGGDEPLLLEVYVNGHSINKIGNFVLRHGVLMAKPEELRELGFRVPAMLQKTDQIPLSALQGFLWSLDTRSQILKVSVSESELIPTLLQRGESPQASSRPGSENWHRVVQSGTGITFNY